MKLFWVTFFNGNQSSYYLFEDGEIWKAYFVYYDRNYTHLFHRGKKLTLTAAHELLQYMLSNPERVIEQTKEVLARWELVK